VALVATWAAAEHASAGPQVALAVPVAALHLLAMGVWLGGLVTLLLLLRLRGADGQEVPAAAIGRFSALAFGAVAVLVGTGVYQSWRQVGSWEALSTTSYGKVLLVKIAAVVLVLWAASFSRRWTARLVHEAPPAARTPAVAAAAERVRVPQTAGAPAPAAGQDLGTASGAPAGEGPGDGRKPPAFDAGAYRRALRRMVSAEAVLGVVVLVITTVLTGTQPGRAAGERVS
ncbi:copper-binding protein, partial [Streptomyces sp. SID7760]|nr:copper-binding protein [Streptomyces sp. SID7760]